MLKVKGKKKMNFFRSNIIFPGSLPNNGILLNRIVSIPVIIRKNPIKMNGDSIFIIFPLRSVL